MTNTQNNLNQELAEIKSKEAIQMKKVTKITTFLDLKNILITIPDEDLDCFGFGLFSECDDGISLLVQDEDMLELFYKYPQTKIINEYIKQIIKVHNQSLDDEKREIEEDGFVSSEGLNE